MNTGILYHARASVVLPDRGQCSSTDVNVKYANFVLLIPCVLLFIVSTNQVHSVKYNKTQIIKQNSQ